MKLHSKNYIMKSILIVFSLICILNYTFSQTNTLITSDTFNKPMLVEIGVKNQGDTNIIKWKTFNTPSADKFVIEHSISGKFFSVIGDINGHIDTIDLINYSFNHPAPMPGLNYYRVKHVDPSGVTTYSKTLTTYNKSSAKLNAFPNPFTDLITIQGEEDQPWDLLDVHGNIILRGNTREIKTNHLPSGTYFLLSKKGSTDYLLKMTRQ